MATLMAGIFGYGYSFGSAEDFIAQQEFAKNLRHTLNKNGYVFSPISKCFLDMHSSVFELQEKLWLTIHSDQGCSHSKENKETNLTVDEDKLFSVISSDFRDGQIVNINGWYISNTEYLMLSYLSRVA